MSFYPVVNDEALLKHVDGWLLNSVYRSLKLRGKLLTITRLPEPAPFRTYCPKAQLVTPRHITREG